MVYLPIHEWLTFYGKLGQVNIQTSISSHGWHGYGLEQKPILIFLLKFIPCFLFEGWLRSFSKFITGPACGAVNPVKGSLAVSTWQNLRCWEERL